MMIAREIDVGRGTNSQRARPALSLICSPAALRWLVAGSLMILAAAASAAEAPPQLLGQTIVMGWNEYRVQRCDDGEEKRGHTSSSLLVYVSEKGRLFTKLSRRGGRGASNSNDVDPEGGNQRAGAGAAGNMNTSFEGSNLVVQNAMQSGARRIQATFDAGFAGCGAQVRFGKEGGGELRHRTMDGKMCNIISTDVSGTTCSIRKGNLVSGG
jgi:hypothetical protein